MAPTRFPRAIVALALALLVAAGCGDDRDADTGLGDVLDGASGDVDGEDEGAGDEGVGGGGAGGGGDCGPTDVEITTPEGTIDVTSTAAVSLEDGAAYTAYLADFELEPEAITMFSSPEVPVDAAMLTLSVTVFNAEEPVEPIEAGTEVRYEGSNFGVLTFVVMVNHGDELYGTAIDAEGTLTVTAVGECFGAEVDYADEEKTVTGTVNAAVRPL